MERHVVVVSVDAMVYEDLQTLLELSAFRPFKDKMARVNRVRSIYPTITYPCHTTMMTGLYPNKHGILNNEAPVLLEKSSLWQHMRPMSRGKSIFDWAKESGLTTASVFWPLTGLDPSIDHLIAEYWPQSKDESTHDCFIHSGSGKDVMKNIVEPNLPILEGRNRQHPWCDIFVMRCACDMLRTYKPNLLTVHPANVDAYRHQTGLFTEKITQSLYETNTWMEELFEAAKDVGTFEDTDFFIVSDHGQLNVSRCVALNALFAENGLIDVDASGQIKDFKAFSKSGGLSALIYLKDPDNKKDYEATKNLLDTLCAQEVYGISQVFTREEIEKKEHLSGPFAFAVETDGYTTFSNDWLRPLVRPLDNQNYRFGRATHGHLPDKGPQPTLFAFGPHIKPGVVLENANLPDEAPTFARALGIDMTGTDGRCLTELFKA